MAIHVRNARTPYTGSTTQTPSMIPWVLRELLFLAGWTEDSYIGARWVGANLEIDEPGGVNGFEVNSAFPRRVYDPLGRFTSGMVGESMIALYGTNDQNRIMSRIGRYISANYIEIDGVSWNNVLGWADEIGMQARVSNPSTTAPFANGNEVILNSPTGNGQLRLYVSSSTAMYGYVRPKGQAADPTEGPSHNIGDGDADFIVVFNMYVDDDSNVFIWWCDETGFHWRLHAGLLEVDDPVSDPDPWYCDVGKGFSLMSTVYAEMMSHTGAIINVYPTLWGFGLNPSEHIYSTSYPNARTVNGHPGRAFLDKPMAAMQNRSPDGGYVRGKFPIIRACSRYFESWRPMDESGLWWHIVEGWAVPRNGLGDPDLMTRAED